MRPLIFTLLTLTACVDGSAPGEISKRFEDNPSGAPNPGLHFRASTFFDDPSPIIPSAGPKTIAVGGTESIEVDEPRPFAGPVNEAINATISAGRALVITATMGPNVRMRAIARGEATLAVSLGVSSPVLSNPRHDLIHLRTGFAVRAELSPVLPLFPPPDWRTPLFILPERSAQVFVRLFDPAGLRLVDRGISGVDGWRWDLVTLDPISPGEHLATLHLSDGAAVRAPVELISAADGIERRPFVTNTLFAASSTPQLACFAAVARGGVVAGLRWSYSGDPSLTLRPFALESCVEVARQLPGAAVLHVQADQLEQDFSLEFKPSPP